MLLCMYIELIFVLQGDFTQHTVISLHYLAVRKLVFSQDARRRKNLVANVTLLTAIILMDFHMLVQVTSALESLTAIHACQAKLLTEDDNRKRHGRLRGYGRDIVVASSSAQVVVLKVFMLQNGCRGEGGERCPGNVHRAQ